MTYVKELGPRHAQETGSRNRRHRPIFDARFQDSKAVNDVTEKLALESVGANLVIKAKNDWREGRPQVAVHR